MTVDLSRHRHLEALRMFSSWDSFGDPVERTRSMTRYNNEHHGAELDSDYQVVQDADGVSWLVAWVFDTRDMPWIKDFPGGKVSGGEIVVCWWTQCRSCDACESYGDVPVYGTRDELLRWEPCPVCGP